MKNSLTLLMAIIGLTAAGPLTSQGLKQSLLSTDVSTRNSALEQLLLDVIESGRELMLTGNDDIPVLDPFHLDSLRIDDQIIPLPGAIITLEDMTVTDLSTFVISSLSVTRESLLFQRYRVEIDGNIPVLDVKVNAYDLFVSVLGFTIFGNGDAKIKIVEPRINAAITVAPRFTLGGIYLNVQDCIIQFNLKSFEPELTGFFNDQAASDFIGAFLKNLISELLNYFEPEITGFLSETVKDVANEILSDLNLISILG